ncbi:MAG: YceI family protein [Taibaiella sp.]|nr:YceI family protein [Taibaiella sp.]
MAAFLRRLHLITLLLLMFLPVFLGNAQVSSIYEVSSGSIGFRSVAPKELISAASDKLKGVMDVQKRTFAFKISMASFLGFNSQLQREHFNENYLETSVFPEAVYKGKILDEVDLLKDGVYSVRTRGKLSVHGVETERVLAAEVTVHNREIEISSEFTVALSDHNIKIPRVVFEKLASEIKVKLTASLKPKA